MEAASFCSADMTCCDGGGWSCSMGPADCPVLDALASEPAKSRLLTRSYTVIDRGMSRLEERFRRLSIPGSTSLTQADQAALQAEQDVAGPQRASRKKMLRLSMPALVTRTPSRPREKMKLELDTSNPLVLDNIPPPRRFSHEYTSERRTSSERSERHLRPASHAAPETLRLSSSASRDQPRPQSSHSAKPNAEGWNHARPLPRVPGSTGQTQRGTRPEISPRTSPVAPQTAHYFPRTTSSEDVFRDMPLLQPCVSAESSEQSEPSLSPHSSVSSRFMMRRTLRVDDSHIITPSPNPSMRASVLSPESVSGQWSPTLLESDVMSSLSPRNSLKYHPGLVRRAVSTKSTQSLRSPQTLGSAWGDIDAGIPPPVPEHRFFARRPESITTHLGHARSRSNGSDIMPTGIFTRRCSYTSSPDTRASMHRHKQSMDSAVSGDLALHFLETSESSASTSYFDNYGDHARGRKERFMLEGYVDGRVLRVVNPDSYEGPAPRRPQVAEISTRAISVIKREPSHQSSVLYSPEPTKYFVPSKALLAEQEEAEASRLIIVGEDEFDFTNY